MADPSKYTIGWICAIATEYTAARAFLDEVHESPEAIPIHDHNAYTLGRLGKHNVVIAVLPDGEYGLSTAGIVAQRMLDSFPNIRIGLMVGIGGGAPTRSPGHDIRLGDVVVSSPRDGHSGVLQYDFGKKIQGQDFKITRALNLPPDILRAGVTELKVRFEEEGVRFADDIETILQRKPRLRRKYGRPSPETDTLFLSHVVSNAGNPISNTSPELLVSRRPRNDDEDNPAVFHGLIASSNQLMKDAVLRDKLAEEKGVLCFEMEAAGLMNHFPCLVIRGICDYSDTHKSDKWQGYAAMTAAAYAKALLSCVLPKRVEAERRLAEVIQAGFQNIAHKVADIGDKMDDGVLERLVVAKGAGFDSYEEQHEPRCLQGTRVGILENIMQWAQNPVDRRIFWLHGIAGTGKSTICRTIAKSFDALGILGASFFFRRGDFDRSNASLFFSTIVKQLVSRRPSLRASVSDALGKTRDICSKGIREQYRELLLNPLKRDASALNNETLVLAIDALDECAAERDVAVILPLLSDLAKTKSFGIKVFVTSRLETVAQSAFYSIHGGYQEVILQGVTINTINADIRTYLCHQLSNVKHDWNARHNHDVEQRLAAGWPGETRLQTLVQLSSPLFIFAATACRFIRDQRFGSPEEQLLKLMRTARESGVNDKLRGTYLPALQQFAADETETQRNQLLAKFRKIIGPIILLQEPLSTTCAASLINLRPGEISLTLSHLSSILDVPKALDMPIRLFHSSFRDFLLGAAAERFSINRMQAHRQIVQGCIKLLSNSLAYNMCSLRPNQHRSTLNKSLLQEAFPPHVRYACVHLFYHLEQAGGGLRDYPQADNFFFFQLLYWLEAMSVIGHAFLLTEISDAMLRLSKISNDVKLIGILEELNPFISKHLGTLNDYPLQLYWSALVFTSSRSLLRTTFSHCIPTAICSVEMSHSSNSPLERILDPYTDDIHFLGVSPDSSLVACGDQKGTVRIWSLATGMLLHQTNVTQGRGGRVVSVAFSADSSAIVSATTSGIFVNAARTGQHMWTLEGTGNAATHLTASSNLDQSPIVVSAHSDCTASLWSLSTGKKLNLFSCPDATTAEEPPSSEGFVGLSGCSKLVAGWFDYHEKTYVWSAATGRCLRSFPRYNSPHDSPLFSYPRVFLSSSMIPSTGGGKHDIRMYDIVSGDCSYVLPQAKSRWRHIAISPDFEFAAARYDNVVAIWSLPNGDLFHQLNVPVTKFLLHFATPPDLVFSADGDRLFYTDGANVYIWSIPILKQGRNRDGHPKMELKRSVADSKFDDVLRSENGMLLASIYSTRQIKLWSLVNGYLAAEFRFPEDETWPFTVHWAPNHRHVVVNNWLCHVDTGATHSLMVNGDGALVSPTFSENSTVLVTTSRGTVVVYDVATANILYRNAGVTSSVAVSSDGELLAYSPGEGMMTYSSIMPNGHCGYVRHHGILHSMIFSPDTEWLAVAFHNHASRRKHSTPAVNQADVLVVRLATNLVHHIGTYADPRLSFPLGLKLQIAYRSGVTLLPDKHLTDFCQLTAKGDVWLTKVDYVEASMPSVSPGTYLTPTPEPATQFHQSRKYPRFAAVFTPETSGFGPQYRGLSPYRRYDLIDEGQWITYNGAPIILLPLESIAETSLPKRVVVESSFIAWISITGRLHKIDFKQ